MRGKHSSLIILALLITAPIFSQSSYLNQLYGYQNTDDWGMNVFVENDGNYFLIGVNYEHGVNLRRIYTRRIAPDGTELLSKIVLSSPVFSYSLGIYGSAKLLPNGNYLMPITRERFGATSQQDTVSAGLLMLDNDGNLLWEKYYTDTLFCRENAWNCNVLPDGDLLIVGERDYYKGPMATMKAILKRTDRDGNLLWQKEHSQCNSFVTVEYDNGNILVGGRKNEFISYNFQYDYHRMRPWFLIYDSSGNLMNDTLYSIKFGGEGFYTNGNITRDSNGGYLHYGTLDSIINPSFDNHPNYIAHLNDKFEITWMKKLAMEPFQKKIYYAMQLRSGSYLYLGLVKNRVFASKLNKSGFTEWDNEYYIDTTYQCYLAAAAERVDGGIIMTGIARSGVKPASQRFDAWVVVVDSNGCLIPNCAPTGVEQVSESATDISIYPNPTTGSFTFQTQLQGILTINNTYGQLILELKVDKGKNLIRLSPGVAAGIYTIRFNSIDGRTIVKRLVCQP